MVLGAESIVDDLSRSFVLLRRGGVDPIEVFESFRIRGAPGAAKVMDVLARVFCTRLSGKREGEDSVEETP